MQSLNNNLIVNGLLQSICQSTPEASSSIQTQSSSDLDIDQGDMIDKTDKTGHTQIIPNNSNIWHRH